jgi:hypothetical protein
MVMNYQQTKINSGLQSLETRYGSDFNAIFILSG